MNPFSFCTILCFVCLQDFKEQIIHHVATIVLITFSWLVNYIRAGTLIMLVHDASDYLMEVCKQRHALGVEHTVDVCCCQFKVVFALFF